ncbi:hypothetical protein [Pseudomonas oryzihabitans]|uniref:hypothetical protein n=1 Tax=Pseudomonas oryzihabitans TaxID=47885 RepID=UPI0011A18463|nr:hypothetical protein [Pseudomonas oryzihabitans]
MEKPIEFVTLVEIDLPRVGSAGAGMGLGMNRQQNATVEIADRSPATIRAAVVALAVKHGEVAANLNQLQQVQQHGYSSRGHELTFNVQNPNASVWYDNPYATCRVHDALKIDGRYFKLEEIRLT